MMREKGLVKMLQTRTPVVETYLQNLRRIPRSVRFRRMTAISSAAWI